jgi:hypothetical protein
MRVIAVMIDIADSAATNQNVLAAVGFSSFTISPSPSTRSRLPLALAFLL